MPALQLQSFSFVNNDSVRSIVKILKYTCCDNDPIPVSEIVICENFGALIDLWTDLVNISTEKKVFPESEKRVIVNPIVKDNLDSQCLSSFRLVSNLTFILKINENVILVQLLELMRIV